LLVENCTVQHTFHFRVYFWPATRESLPTPGQKPERGPWKRARRPMRDGFVEFYVFHYSSCPIIPLDRPVAPLTQQVLRYQGVPREDVAVCTFA